MISIKNLSKSYKLDNGEEIPALKNINLEVEEGEILGIIGTSGSGKTSLLRILRGVEKFDEGEFTLSRYTIKPDSSQFYFNQIKKETAIHLQRSFGIWPETVLDNVLRKLYGAKYGDEASCNLEEAHDQFDKEAMELLELVGLDHKADHLASVLSGGEKQRLIMARQLAKKPKVMLLDEPATMACPKTKQEILDAVKKINEELNITIILVSHLPEIHKFLADMVILLEDGEIAKLVCRFMEYDIMSDTCYCRNDDPSMMYGEISAVSIPDMMNVTRTNSTYTAAFTSGVMNAYHGASVPSGWIVPFSYVNVGRPQSKDEECAKVRLIVPHSQGHADASSNVKPFYYVITFEREA